MTKVNSISDSLNELVGAFKEANGSNAPLKKDIYNPIAGAIDNLTEVIKDGGLGGSGSDIELGEVGQVLTTTGVKTEEFGFGKTVKFKDVLDGTQLEDILNFAPYDREAMNVTCYFFDNFNKPNVLGLALVNQKLLQFLKDDGDSVLDPSDFQFFFSKDTQPSGMFFNVIDTTEGLYGQEIRCVNDPEHPVKMYTYLSGAIRENLYNAEYDNTSPFYNIADTDGWYEVIPDTSTPDTEGLEGICRAIKMSSGPIVTIPDKIDEWGLGSIEQAMADLVLIADAVEEIDTRELAWKDLGSTNNTSSEPELICAIEFSENDFHQDESSDKYVAIKNVPESLENFLLLNEDKNILVKFSILLNGMEPTVYFLVGSATGTKLAQIPMISVGAVMFMEGFYHLGFMAGSLGEAPMVILMSETNSDFKVEIYSI